MEVFSDFDLGIYKTLKMTKTSTLKNTKTCSLWPWLRSPWMLPQAKPSLDNPIITIMCWFFLAFLLLVPVQLLCKLLGLVLGPEIFWVNYDSTMRLRRNIQRSIFSCFDILGGFICQQPEEYQGLGATQVSQQFDQLGLLITLFNLVVIIFTVDDVLLYLWFCVFAVVVLVISRLGVTRIFIMNAISI